MTHLELFSPSKIYPVVEQRQGSKFVCCRANLLQVVGSSGGCVSTAQVAYLQALNGFNLLLPCT
jgi:hypothetical protein